MRNATDVSWAWQGRIVGCFSFMVVGAALGGCADDRRADEEQLQSRTTATLNAEVQNLIESQYAHANVRNTFRTRLGQDIDCVDFAAQPAFKMPGLDPSLPIEPPPLHGQHPVDNAVTDLNDGTLDDAGNVRGCPGGTVPIARLSAAAIERAGGVDAFLSHAAFKNPHPLTGSKPPVIPAFPPLVVGYEYSLGVNQSFVRTDQAESFDSTFGVYQPAVAVSIEHSISQVWVASQGLMVYGGCSPNCAQTLEAGWNVDPFLYGDSSPHLFTFSTQDGYNTTGCYNLMSSCGHAGSGFVLWPGAPYTPGQLLSASVIGSNPVEFSTEWEAGGSAWWFFVNGRPIGYVPQSLFNNGQGGSVPLSWFVGSYYKAGGEVYDTQSGGLHTTTDMGSGNFASAGYRQAAYQRNVRIWHDDGDNNQYPVDALLSPTVTDPSNYTESSSPAAGGTGWGTYFYFGGPGRVP